MARFLGLRVLQSMALMFGVLLLVFLMVRVTGNPVSLMVSREATAEQRAAFIALKGLDRPVLEQFFSYMSTILRGDLDKSLSLGIPNTILIAQRLPATIELAFISMLLALTVAIPLGLISGMYPNSPVDIIARVISLAGQTMPTYWLAMILILVFAVNLRLLPSFGRDGFKSLILPAIALAIGLTGQLLRLIRASVLENRQQGYVRTAYSKGLSRRSVSFFHIFPNVLVPLISVLGVQFTYLLGGSVYIETVFSWPGLGSLLNNAINSSDFPLVQAISLVIALMVITVNLLTDVLYHYVDPRMRNR